MRLGFLAVCLIAMASGAAPGSEFSPEQIEFFEAKVRPLFLEHCAKCHGADQQKGGLRLDSRAALLTGGDTGAALVPGKPDESELIRAVRYDADGYQMPPDGKLPPEKLAVLEKWVAEGAAWPAETAAAASGADKAAEFAARAKHWSFQPLRRPAVPAVTASGWTRNPIDRFVLSRLEQQGLSPAPEADLITRNRRAAFDLVGLPPKTEPADEEQLARQIDEWLASPHFGERWGRHWLDLVRYAESRGHEFDYDVANPWHYRDYVIRAMNDDVRYDQLVVEHVAGDLLTPDSHPFATRVNPTNSAGESIVGTGFWYFGDWVHSPVDLKQDEADRVSNMVEVYGKAFLGLTISCARCHDHKFDPITQRDFYSIAGYVASAGYVQAPYESREHNRAVAAELDRINQEAAAIVRDWAASHASAGPALAGDSEPFAQSPGAEAIVDYRAAGAKVISDGEGFGARPRQVGDLRWGGTASRPVQSLVETAAVERDSAFNHAEPAEGVADDSGTEGWKRAGRTLVTPSFVVGPGKVYAWVRGGCRTYAAVDSHLMIRGPLHGQLLKDHPPVADWHWIEHDLSRYQGHLGHLEFVLRDQDDFAVQLVVQADQPPPLLVSGSEGVRALNGRLAAASGGNSDADVAALNSRLQPLFERRASLVSRIQTRSEATPAMLEGGGVDLPLFVRGNPHKTGDAVPRQFLGLFDASKDASATALRLRTEDLAAAREVSPRLELALRMVDPGRTPITARVIVNRIWQHYFGAGLVASADDFGLMGSPPSHPELLDWLALELIEHDWSMKHIHRLILDSAAYRMASYLPAGVDDATRSQFAQAEELDPNNVWLHRMPVKRLEGEVLRDAILSASGRLDDAMYGRSIPVHLTEHHDGRGKPSLSGPKDGAGRRSLYLAVRRNFPEPLLQAFDFPVPSTTRGRRSVSNVPAQALALMNSPFVAEEAERFARRLLENSGDDGDRITAAFEIAYSRTPTAAEQDAARAFVTESARDRNVSTSDPAPWVDLCHALMNAKEFAFIP